MGNPQAAELEAALRMLPSTDELLSSPTFATRMAEIGRRRSASLVRMAIDEVRRRLTDEILTKSGRVAAYSKESLMDESEKIFESLWKTRVDARMRRLINATGVVIHTNLGRAPLSEASAESIRNALGYCTLEYDLATGKRGKRGAYLESLLAEATGAEAAIVVNNCAAAAYLVLTVFAKGGEAIVSRGELVEIGGDFRVPDVLAQSGATMKEVGTTNRTKLVDYERAINDATKIIVRVHPSNYKIVGFTEKPLLNDLAKLARKEGILIYEDAGSGALFDLRKFGLDDEPVITQSIVDGADIVTFSGDKLLGSAQAGIIVGKKNLIEQIRKHPLYRALRVSKIVYAALEASVDAFLREDAEQSIPVLRMLSMTKDELADRARKFEKELRSELTGVKIELTDGQSVVGGGSAPNSRRETVLISIEDDSLSAAEVESRLRMGETPVVARIENDRVLIDLRTVQENEETRLVEMLARALA